MDKILERSYNLMLGQHFDSLGVGVVDFSSSDYSFFQVTKNQDLEATPLLFDIASLTKPLTMAYAYHKDSSLFNDDMRLLLEHRSGLPVWGRLSHLGWKEQISSYVIKESKSSYSDFGALRLMLELEQKLKTPLYDFVNGYWNNEIIHWEDIKNPCQSPLTGFRHGSAIQGEVNDDNAFYLGGRLSHAGLFSTVEGLCKTLLALQESTQFIDSQLKDFDRKPERFLNGWDTVSDIKTTLAGPMVGPKTFGHLGFTGTSIWIDAEKRKASIILTNATQNYWFERKGLAKLRREIGSLIFS